MIWGENPLFSETSRWWQLKYFLFSSPNGEDEPHFDWLIFFKGVEYWNHQLEKFWHHPFWGVGSIDPGISPPIGQPKNKTWRKQKYQPKNFQHLNWQANQKTMKKQKKYQPSKFATLFQPKTSPAKAKALLWKLSPAFSPAHVAKSLLMWQKLRLIALIKASIPASKTAWKTVRSLVFVEQAKGAVCRRMQHHKSKTRGHVMTILDHFVCKILSEGSWFVGGVGRIKLFDVRDRMTQNIHQVPNYSLDPGFVRDIPTSPNLQVSTGKILGEQFARKLPGRDGRYRI